MSEGGTRNNKTEGREGGGGEEEGEERTKLDMMKMKKEGKDEESPVE